MKPQIMKLIENCKMDVTSIILTTENAVITLSPEQIIKDALRPFDFGYWTSKPKKD